MREVLHLNHEALYFEIPRSYGFLSLGSTTLTCCERAEVAAPTVGTYAVRSISLLGNLIGALVTNEAENQGVCRRACTQLFCSAPHILFPSDSAGLLVGWWW